MEKKLVGETYKLSCECGYEKVLNLGGGLAICSINMVNRIFSEEKCREFNKYYIKGGVINFFIENEISFCDKCKEIMSTPVLNIQIDNNKKVKIENECSFCNNRVRIMIDLPECPKCGNKLIKKDIGHWD